MNNQQKFNKIWILLIILIAILTPIVIIYIYIQINFYTLKDLQETYAIELPIDNRREALEFSKPFFLNDSKSFEEKNKDFLTEDYNYRISVFKREENYRYTSTKEEHWRVEYRRIGRTTNNRSVECYYNISPKGYILSSWPCNWVFK